MLEPEETRFIIDDRDRGIFKVNRRAFTARDVYELEQERLFEHSWLYVGHTSEVRNPGDFQARRLGERSVILVHGSDGEVRVLLNTCRHRGAEVCRERSGNTKSFQCFYHGWTYSNEGELIGVPDQGAYPPNWDREVLRLATPPRVETYRGFVFASFDLEIEPLEDYLADAREYLDLVCDQSEIGMEIVGGTQSYGIRANWKLLAENSLDAYHGPITHARYTRFLQTTDAGAELRGLGGHARNLGNGHAVMEYESPWGRPLARWVPSFGPEKRPEIESVERRFEERFGKERGQRITQMSRNILIFPNLVVNDIMAITVRSFYPSAPDQMMVNAWCLAPRQEPKDDRALRLDNFLTFLGPGGFATPDDVEGLESCQRGYRNKEVGWNDISRHIHLPTPTPAGELQMRTFWRRWNELMTRDPAEARQPRRLRAL